MRKRRPARWPWFLYWLVWVVGIVILCSYEAKATEQESPSHDAAHVFVGAAWQYVCTQKLDGHPVVCFAALAAGVALKEYLIDENPDFGRDGLGYAGGAVGVTIFTWRF